MWDLILQEDSLKQKEIEIHEKLHEKHFQSNRTIGEIFSSKRLQRQKDILKAEKWHGIPLHGHILEVGSGDGWASAWIGTMPNVQSVVALECTKAATEKLIPQTFEIVGTPKEKRNVCYGSFNNIPFDNDKFDCVIAMGALHHSENLLKTLKECRRVLKPNGILIAQEPAMENWVSNAQFLERYKKMKEFWGVATIREDERSDHFFRVCEWLTASYHAGFDVKWEVSKISGEPPEGPLDLLMLLTKPGERLEYIPHLFK